MSFKIVLRSGFSAYSVDLEYSFEPLVQRKDDGRNRSFTTISNQDPEAARHFGFQPGESNPPIEWTVYDNGEDKSNSSLLDSSIKDNRLAIGKKDEDDATGDIVNVDTTNEVVSVSGDVTNRVSSSDSIRVAGSTGNDDEYTVSSVSYDSNNNETDITVQGDIFDSTADGWVQKGVETTFQQEIWVVEYIQDNTSDPRWLLFGGRWSDRDGDGSNEGTNVVVKNADLKSLAGRNAKEGKIDFKLGVTI